RELIATALEQRRAQTVRRVYVVRIAVERRSERRGRQLIPASAQPTPAQTVVESFPHRLTTQRTLESHDGATIIADEIFRPSEHRPRLIVLRIEQRRLGEVVARLLVLAFLELDATPLEAQLRLHASAEALEESSRRRQAHRRARRDQARTVLCLVR